MALGAYVHRADDAFFFDESFWLLLLRLVSLRLTLPVLK
jgi:hypothetical protein